MICPKCNSPVIGVRNNPEPPSPEAPIRRRRHCRICKHLFWTVETIEGQAISMGLEAQVHELLDRLLPLLNYKDRY